MDVRYAAGLFDGEGYIRVAVWKKPNSTHTRYQVYGGINMCHRPVIEALHAQFGGSMPNPGRRISPAHRPLFTWNISSQIAASFLRQVLPFLIVKKDEAVLCLHLQSHIDEHKIGIKKRDYPNKEAIFSYRASLAREIALLKHRTFTD